MRITIVDIDATPEEIARSPQVVELLESLARRQRSTAAAEAADAANAAANAAADLPRSSDAGDDFPQPLRAVLNANGPGGVLQSAIEQFLSELLSWPGVEHRLGASRVHQDNSGKVVRLHRRGTGVGAFVYLELPRGNVRFRLPKSHDLRAYPHARARAVQDGAPYGVALRLIPSAVPEAVTLARHSYDATTE